MTPHRQLISLKTSLVVLMLITTASTGSAAFSISTASATSFTKLKHPTHQQSFRIQTDLNAHAIDSEDEAMMMMMKAHACANSETCSIDDAENYLKEMLHLQSSCASGSLSSTDICDDITYPTDVIAGLRDKIQRRAELSNQASSFEIGLNPVFLTIFAVYVYSGLISLTNPDSFTMQEWMYAFQGGYLDNMVSQYIKYGGFSPVESSFVGLPMTAQELWWSIRDGYVGNMVTEYQHYGGFGVDITTDPDAILTTPFTADEWKYALKDGYLSDMIEHYMRHGGL